jgi:hypothetical protein
MIFLKSVIKIVSRLLLAGSAVCFGQQNDSTTDRQPTKDTMAGVVEAEIGSGDLKLGRFAQIIAIPAPAAAQIKAALVRTSDVLNQERSKALDQLGQDNLELACIKGVITFAPAFVSARQAGASNPSARVVQSDADELGEFTLKGLAPNTPYTVIAIGKTGMNDAIWLADFDLAPAKRIP